MPPHPGPGHTVGHRLIEKCGVDGEQALAKDLSRGHRLKCVVDVCGKREGGEGGILGQFRIGFNLVKLCRQLRTGIQGLWSDVREVEERYLRFIAGNGISGRRGIGGCSFGGRRKCAKLNCRRRFVGNDGNALRQAFGGRFNNWDRFGVGEDGDKRSRFHRLAFHVEGAANGEDRQHDCHPEV